MFHRRLTIAPHIQRVHRAIGALPFTHQVLAARDPLQIFVERPQNDRRLDIFAAQTFQHAQGSSGLAAHGGIADLQDVETRAVGDGIDDRIGGDWTGRQQQRQLLHFLMGRQQVAFDALGKQRRGICIGFEILLSESIADPRRQPRQLDRPDLHDHAMLLDRADPTRALHATVHLAGDHQHQVVRRRLRGELDDGIRALLARRRIGHADLDDLALGEQRQRATARDERIPIEAALDHVQLALGEALRSGPWRESRPPLR